MKKLKKTKKQLEAAKNLIKSAICGAYGGYPEDRNVAGIYFSRQKNCLELRTPIYIGEEEFLMDSEDLVIAESFEFIKDISVENIHGYACVFIQAHGFQSMCELDRFASMVEAIGVYVDGECQIECGCNDLHSYRGYFDPDQAFEYAWEKYVSSIDTY